MSVELATVELARDIARLGAGEQARVYRMSWWSDRLLGLAMARARFKTQLFRFVDVFPATTDDADVFRHAQEYFADADAPRLFETAMRTAAWLPGGRGLTGRIARRNIRRMAQQFIVGSNVDETVAGLRRIWDAGSAFTVDLLGEKTVAEEEADAYAARVQQLVDGLVRGVAAWPGRPLLESDDLGRLPRANVSIKPTALASKYAPLTRQAGLAQAKERLLPILRHAAANDVFVYFDMEHYDVKDVTLQLFTELLDEPSLSSLHAGIVVQAYLKDSYLDLRDLIAWSARRSVPVGVRLVKGAYWDAETITARAEGWGSPVYEEKAQSDANYERCVDLLHDNHGAVRAAFASHNLRSLAYAVSAARGRGIPDEGVELQMLYGMAEPIQAAIRRLGLRLRVYTPMGELVPGMAYLVRRLLENTSNESFVRHRFAEGREVDELVAAPTVEALPEPPAAARRAATDPTAPGPYHHEPLREWRRADVRAAFADAVASQEARPAAQVPAVIGGERVTTTASITSVDPGDSARTVAVSASCGAPEADRAVAVACGVEETWRRTPVAERAAVLFRAAEWMRARRDELAAVQVFEAGKPWAEADADVCEAVDFCEYYGREMLRLDEGGAVLSPPGEQNRMRYQGKGVGVVIAPWNFPLAIPTGMVVAALVTGNPVILKPAEQTPLTAFALVEALEAAGLPPGVLGFLPGIGEDVGAHLVAHPDVAFVTFTGSLAVGLAINQAAATPRPGQRHVKRVVAEMGGKNALVVDADADLDQVVPAVLHSAFGFAGQKCSAASRLIVLDAVHDTLVERLVAAARRLQLGHARHMGTQVGPVVDAEAYKRLTHAIERAHGEARVLVTHNEVPEGGYYVPPTIVTDVATDSWLARQEFFGPLLAVFRARHIDHAFELANDTDYALTAGIFSRSPEVIRRAGEELRAGNVYVNRGTTGAVVGRQPFGGYGLSGVGSKAGGPDYLLQFLDPRVVTENTLRQGFAPDA